jgi:hypothetical protein
MCSAPNFILATGHTYITPALYCLLCDQARHVARLLRPISFHYLYVTFLFLLQVPSFTAVE